MRLNVGKVIPTPVMYDGEHLQEQKKKFVIQTKRKSTNYLILLLVIININYLIIGNCINAKIR